MELKTRQNTHNDSKFAKIYAQYGELLSELRKKELSQNIVILINESVEQINASELTETQLGKLVKQKQTIILKQAEKELKVVPQNHYRNIWMLLGFTALGLPIGIILGLSLGNMGLLSIGLPIGMGIGVLIGLEMDKKALSEGRQLNLEIKN